MSEYQYVIEHDGLLYGPFESKSDATDFALQSLATPWMLHAVTSPSK
jgi:hypothetical protein